MASHRLILDELVCGRGERALFAGVCLRLESGRIVRVLGENGAGKTTLLRTVAGLHQPLAGRVEWQGGTLAEDPGEPATLRDEMCFVGHDNALDGTLTPVENLDLLMRIAGQRRDTKQLAQTLARLDLGSIAHRACRRLSAGQRRRVSLARLWLTRAPLWLLDEPAAALDVASRERLAARIGEHVGAGGLVLFTTHESLALPNTKVETLELAPC